MANNRVEYSDIYSETLVKQIQELNKELLDSVTMIEKLAKQGVTLSTVTQDVSNNISEQTKKEKELFDFEKKSLEQQKSYEKINKQLLDQQEKLSEAVLRKKKADADALAIAKQQAIINDKEAGTLEKLTAEYKLLEIQKRKINQETEEGRKQYASMVSRMDELTTSIKKQGSEAEKQRMNIGNYEGSTVSLRQELKNITMQLAQMQLRGETNSEVFKNLAQRGGEIKDVLSDISQRMKVVGSDTKHIDMVVGSFMALGSAVQVAEGSMQLLGVENQDVQKGIQKLVAIQSVMNGVQQIANSLQKESAFMIGLATAKTWLLTTAQKVYAVAVGTSTGAMKLFRTALLATGIGAVIAGISLLTEWIINLSNSTDEGTESFNKMNEELERQKKLYEEISKSDQTKFDLQNKQNEEMIRQQKLLGMSEVNLLKLEKQLAENKENQAIKNNNNFIKEFGNYEKINGKVEELTTLLNLQGIPEKRRIQYSKQLEYYNGLLEKSGKYSLEVTMATNDLLEVQNKLNDAINAEIKNRDIRTKTELDTKMQSIEVSKLEMKQSEEKFDFDEKMKNKLHELELSQAEGTKNATLENNAEIAEERMEQLNKIEQKTTEIGELTNMQIEAGALLADSVFERRQAQLDSNYNKEVANIEAEKQKAIKAGMDKTKAEETQKNKLEALDRRNKYESAKNARKTAIWDKTSAIVQAGINTLVSVAKVLWNPFLATAVGVAGAATVTAIGLKPIPEVPTYRKGTKSHKGGHAIVGEVGEELIETPSGKVFLSPDKPTLMNLPKGTRVTPHDVIKRHLSGFNNAHILTPQPYSDKKMNELIDVVKNKREHIINIDKEGISVIAKNGLNRTKFINSYYRS